MFSKGIVTEQSNKYISGKKISTHNSLRDRCRMYVYSSSMEQIANVPKAIAQNQIASNA